MDLLMEEIKENENLNLNIIPSEEDFKDKFPFNLEEEEEEKVLPPVIRVDTKINNEMNEVKKKDNKDDLIRQKYD